MDAFIYVLLSSSLLQRFGVKVEHVVQYHNLIGKLYFKCKLRKNDSGVRFKFTK